MLRALACLMTMTIAAAAEDAKPLTYGDMINATGAITSMDPRPGKDGRLEPSPYKFSPATRMTLGRVVDIGNTIVASFNKGILALDAKLEIKPGSEVPPDKRADFEAERQKLLDTPAFVQPPRVKMADLCLEARPPDCPVANEIPFSTLALLKPVIADWDAK